MIARKNYRMPKNRKRNIEVKPKKSLGQHFLKDKNIACDIVELLGTNSDGIIIEIGPGTGILTEELLKTHTHLTAVELDIAAVELLKKKFSNSKYPGLDIQHKNILNFDIAGHFGLNGNHSGIKKVKVIGNIPYYLTAPILFYLFDNSNLIDKAVLTVQQEVAKRLTAQTATKSYGILTVAVNLAGSAKIAFDIPPDSFYPPPKVNSSVVELSFNDKFDELFFYSTLALVKAAFSQRRKVLINSLNQYLRMQNKLDPYDFARYVYITLNIDIQKSRAEELSLSDFIHLNAALKDLKEYEKKK